jgi:chemotaxis signal transduction protein
MTGGVLFRVSGSLYFLPASVATRVAAVPEVARVPGAPRELVGVALVEGDMIPVVNVSDPQGAPPSRESLRKDAVAAMIICNIGGDRIGLAGLDVVATGFVEGRGAAFDVGAVVARVREGRWAV